MKGPFNRPAHYSSLPRWKVLEGERVEQVGYQVGVRLHKGEVEVALFFPADGRTGHIDIFEDTQITKIMGGM